MTRLSWIETFLDHAGQWQLLEMSSLTAYLLCVYSSSGPESLWPWVSHTCRLNGIPQARCNMHV